MIDLNSSVVTRKTVSTHINDLIDSAMTTTNKAQKRRDYLGASMLGKACTRAVQYEYAGAPKDAEGEFTGKILRIFDAGHQFEALTIKWLRMAGFDLLTERKDGGQFGFETAGGKIKGHIDGVIVAGAELDGAKYPLLWEHKTMNAKAWNDVVKKGVRSSKPIYYAQINLYMAYMKLDACLFTAMNKNTQELYHEICEIDTAEAQRITDKAVNILQATEAGELLPRAYAQEDHFECKMCSWRNRCWSSA